jgi:ABC-type transport system involved in multi-copper enzyme maturation permease subunit
MLRFVSADWIRVSRSWLSWILLVLLIVILLIQVNGKLNDLAEMEMEIETGVSPITNKPLTASQLEGNQFLIDQLQEQLRYPAFIGTVARLSTNLGWFFIIVFAAVGGGEDFSRRTLRMILARGVRRSDYVLARTLTLWLAAGVAMVLITVLAAAYGTHVHGLISDDPISLKGLGSALACVLRSWITYLPFIVATLFWAILGRSAGPALGLGITLHAFEFLNGYVIPIVAAVITSANRTDVPLIYHWQIKLFSITLGYNANIFLNWDNPHMADTLYIVKTIGLGWETLQPSTPERALLMMAGFTILFLGWTVWILRRRDLTYET